MTEHTPGPWQFRSNGYIYSLATGEQVCTPHSGLRVDAGHKVKDHMRDCKKNGRLIAAAPELLASLEEMVLLKGHLTQDPVTRRAMDVIAKAKGGVA